VSGNPYCTTYTVIMGNCTRS